jgi:tetratricopeptide (TPR) repeat protein
MASGALAALVCVWLASGCTARDEATPSPADSTGDASAAAGPTAPDGRRLRPVPLPDLSKVAPSVQAQVRDRHTAVEAALGSRATTAAGLADEYGALGKLLMAAQYPEAAEASFANAQTLAPADYRWPYYLAHLSRGSGDVSKSISLFERALQLQPNDIAALVWLGDLELAQGRPDQAHVYFSKALSLQPGSLSARYGLGRTALARQDFGRAVTYLEEVLAKDPEAAAAHYPLALAYQGLGNAARAEAHLRLREEHEILPADPLMVELDELLESPQAYESRGIRALDAKDWPGAAALFRKGLALEPRSAALRHRLGTALYMMGDVGGARGQFEEVVRTSPDHFPAQYSLGVLLQDEGRHADAIERFSTALRHRPTYTEARLRLAFNLRRARRAKESLSHYEQVLQVSPDLAEARLGYAMALLQAGRALDARDRLAEAMKAHPDNPIFAHGLARLLAAAPDDRVRDGRRALALVEEILQREQRSVELGETVAMALAAEGRYEEAASVQRDLIAGVQKAGLADLARRLGENLQLYERNEPCRTPWTENQMP